MPEFTHRDLKAQIERLGFTIEKTGKNHFKIKKGNATIYNYPETHGKNVKRGMIKPFFYKTALDLCHQWINENPS